MHAYDSVSTNTTKCQEVAHVIYMAAADALMCPKVGKLLEPIGASHDAQSNSLAGLCLV